VLDQQVDNLDLSCQRRNVKSCVAFLYAHKTHISLIWFVFTRTVCLLSRISFSLLVTVFKIKNKNKLDIFNAISDKIKSITSTVSAWLYSLTHQRFSLTECAI